MNSIISISRPRECRSPRSLVPTALTLALLAALTAGPKSASAQGAPDIVWTQPAHSAKVSAVQFWPDGTLLASGGDNTVKLWRAPDGALVRTLTQRFSSVTAVSFSPDGSRLAVGTSAFNQNLNVWRVADGALLFGRISAHANGTQGVAYSPDGQLLATGGRDRTTKIWSAANMALLKTFNDAFRVTALAYSPDGTFVVSGTQNGIHLWRVADGVLLRTLNPQTSTIFAVAISPDGSLVAANSVSGISVWQTATGVLVHNLNTVNNGDPTSLAFSPDGHILLAGNDVLVYPHESGVIRAWRVADGALLKVYDQQTGPAGVSVNWAPNGATFSYGRYDGIVSVARSPF